MQRKQMIEQTRFARLDMEKLIKYQTACQRALAYSHMPSIEKCLQLLQKELKNRELKKK